MVSINYSAREVCCKIVYYGPGLSGKTTNLQYVHSKVPGNSRGDLISLATESDRTLYFDFLPINIGTINGFQAKFQLFTVPGQVYYNATRKLVLRGVDGIVFVADSQPDKMDENIESLVNLEENLREFGYEFDNIPTVIQYNKRDIPNVLTVEQLHQKLNPKGLPHFEASATIGNGVFGTLKMIIKLVLDKAKEASSGKATGSTAVTVNQNHQENQESSPTVESAVAGAADDTGPIPMVAGAPERQTASPMPNSAPVETSAPPAVELSRPTAVANPEPMPVTQVASGPEAAVAEAAVAQSNLMRPFPGSERTEHRERRLSPAAFAPSTRQEIEPSTLGQHVADDTQAPDDMSHRVGMTPQMAPSLKRQNKIKKRGFFKRLFGIR